MQDVRKTTPEISIIIPVYNVEKWLKRACNSLKAQTFINYDVWLVDDGSTDKSGEVCDKIAVADARFNVIHQKNAGAAAARNAAFQHAKGKYYYFMDPDDWCEPRMLEILHKAAEQDNAQLVVTGYYIDTYYSDEKYYEELRNVKNATYSDAGKFRKAAAKLFDEQLLYTPWNKLYLRSHLEKEGVKFPATFWDDLPFNLDVVRNIERVTTVDDHFYHFLRARAEAENTKYRADMYDKREEEDTWMRDLYKGWGIDDWHADDKAEVDEFLARRYSERLIGCVENLTCKSCTLSRSERRQEVTRITRTPRAIESYKLTRPKSTMMRLMLLPYKWKNTTLIMWESKFISFVKRHSTNLFARLKANR